MGPLTIEDRSNIIALRIVLMIDITITNVVMYQMRFNYSVGILDIRTHISRIKRNTDVATDELKRQLGQFFVQLSSYT